MRRIWFIAWVAVSGATLWRHAAAEPLLPSWCEHVAAHGLTAEQGLACPSMPEAVQGVPLGYGMSNAPARTLLEQCLPAPAVEERVESRTLALAPVAKLAGGLRAQAGHRYSLASLGVPVSGWLIAAGDVELTVSASFERAQRQAVREPKQVFAVDKLPQGAAPRAATCASKACGPTSHVRHAAVVATPALMLRGPAGVDLRTRVELRPKPGSAWTVEAAADSIVVRSDQPLVVAQAVARGRELLACGR